MKLLLCINYKLFDTDIVEHRNTIRQNFSTSDVGKMKSAAILKSIKNVNGLICYNEY